MAFYIYTLSNPFTRNIFYVGCSADFFDRMKQHKYQSALNRCKSDLVPKDYYILAHEIDPVCHIIECVFGDIEEAHKRESYWIGFFLSTGKPLMNKKFSSDFVGCGTAGLPVWFSPLFVPWGMITTVKRKHQRILNEDHVLTQTDKVRA